MIDIVLAAIAALPQPAAAPATEVHENVVIASVSAEPGIPSGVIATAVRIIGKAGGESRDYFIFFHIPGQPSPKVGATCRIAFSHFDFGVHFEGRPASAPGGRAVRHFQCDGGEVVDPERWARDHADDRP